MIMTLISFSFFVICLLLPHNAMNQQQERTRKADKASLEQIKRLINQKAQRDFVQNDHPAGQLADDPAEAKRNPEARRHHDELAVNDPDGEYLQGDMELAAWQAERLLKAEDTRKRRRKRKIGRRWDKRRPISFDMADSVPEQTRAKIRQALATWQGQTCLRFREGGPDVDRLEFFDGGGCSSFVGRAGGTQGISIASPGCAFPGIIAHEIGHALGTFHEQARPDQPRHIAVHYGNIPASRWNNFQPVSEDQAATFGLPYDAGSVMHYGPYGFAADQFRPTISTLDRHWQSTIGQREGPSFLDILAINQAYRCHEQCQSLGQTAIECRHGGYPNPNACGRCLCPSGFAGQFCEKVHPSPCGASIQVSPIPRSISTPSHPGPFPPGLHCFWLLQAPPGAHVFLQFSTGDQYPFGYPCEDTCDKAFVELKTGLDFRVTGYRLCCASAPTAVFRSAGSEMVVIHSAADPEGSGPGFRATTWSDLDWPPEVTMRTTTEPTTTTPDASVAIDASSSALTDPPLPDSSTSSAASSNSSSSPSEYSSASPNPSSSASTPAASSSALPPPSPSAECHCEEWSQWGDCSQMCGGCGRKVRQRTCVSDASAPLASLCQTEEKRLCNQLACPAGTNFLFNNGEFHLLWKGCCVGMFLRNATAPNGSSIIGECGPLESNENAFLRIISSLLTSQDAKEGKSDTKSGRRRTGEH